MHHQAALVGLVVLTGSLLLSCADETAPVFSAGALEAEVTASVLRLGWPSANDERGVTRYVVRLDGVEVAELGGGARAYTIADLDESSRHEAEVQAFDAAGNASWVLRTSVTTLDATPPTWPENAALEVAIEERQGDVGALTLSWPEAEDAGGVTGYAVIRAGLPAGAVEAPTRAHRFAPGPLEATRFAVTAQDAAGNVSAPLALDWIPPDEATPRVATREGAGDSSPLLMRILGPSGEGGTISDLLTGGDVGSADQLDQALANPRGATR